MICWTLERRKGRINKLNQIKYKKDKKQGEMNMRKNVNKKSNNRSKVVSALAMLLVSAVALSSASYAWFTMSKKVEVNGIELTATAPDNVLICNNNSVNTDVANYASVKTLVAGTADMYKGGTTTNLATTDLLLPASSTNGVKLYQTSDIADNGADKAADSEYKDATNATDAKEVYFVDIPLYILTTGSKDINVAIDTKKSSITPKDTTEIYKAVRFAVLSDDSSANKGGTFEADSKMINNNPVESVQGTTATYETKNSAKKLDASVDGAGDNIKLVGTAKAKANANVNEAGNPKYECTKVVVRVWIEGQNAACITKNANQTFDVKLVFKYTGDVTE